MRKFVVALFAAAALFAALAVPAFANGNLGFTLQNRGTSTCVNSNAYHADGHDDVIVGGPVCTRP